jgi:hypothetical protein
MNKLRLNVDSLRVESFVPAPLQADVRGTVHPHQSEPQEPQTIIATCECPPSGACSGVASCDWSCGCPTTVTCGENTCGQYTCVESCYPCVPKG